MMRILRERKYRSVTDLCFFDVVFSAEPLNASGGVYQLLLACKERMAGGTNFNFHVLDGGTRLNHITAGAGNLRYVVFRMNLILHV